MKRIPFSKEELVPSGFYPPGRPDAPPIPIPTSPISARENLQALLDGEGPLWMPHQAERLMFNPSLLPDTSARGFVMEAIPFDRSLAGGKDMFGVEWEFDPSVNGSMVRPGNPLVTDLEHWEEQVSFPDLNQWDWAGSAEANQKYLNCGRTIVMTIFTGLFERLVSFVGMDTALIALVDEELQPSVHRLFERLTCFYEELFQNIRQWYHCDVLWFHDDWGSQRGPLFAPYTLEEMVLPYLKRIIKTAHSLGMYFELHSCGKNELLVPAMIQAGVDMWAGQELNDKQALCQTYGDQIKLGVEPNPLPPDAPEQTVRDEIRRLLDAYPNRNVFVGLHRGIHPLEYPILYEESRIRYSSTP